MANKKILVIEDEHELVQVLQIRLEAAGYDVLAAGPWRVDTFSRNIIVCDSNYKDVKKIIVEYGFKTRLYFKRRNPVLIL